MPEPPTDPDVEQSRQVAAALAASFGLTGTPVRLDKAAQAAVEALAEVYDLNGAVIMTILPNETEEPGRYAGVIGLNVARIARQDLGRVLSAVTSQLLRDPPPQDAQPNRAARRRAARGG